MNLQEQLDKFLNKHPKKEECITAKEFKQLFLLGFAKQMQINIEQFFDFTVEDTGNGNCNIIAKLKFTNETTCHILNEFFLKENLSQVKQMFGTPNEMILEEIGNGTVEIK